ncbi:MAG: (d)CMP kinase, partial [Oscillospiraceae bacterium]|nr:(d)CMP kinase [Oscillospiraceae bacterium]
QVKIFLSADSRIRAQRRHKELLEKGDTVTFEEVLADIEKRDWQDINRKEAPLRQADDAVLLDTSHLDFEQAVQAVLDIIDKKVKLK